MRKPRVAPALPTAERVKSTRTKKVEDLATPKQMLDELLKQIIVEAKSFRRPNKREHQDGEK
jgi:hypothetical protein